MTPRAIAALAVPVAAVTAVVVAAILRPTIVPDPTQLDPRPFNEIWRDRIAQPLADQRHWFYPPASGGDPLSRVPEQRLPFPTPVKTMRIDP